MKRLLVIMVLVMTVVAANAQRTPVKVADLQKTIIDNVAKDYAGFTIKEATKVVTNNVVTYEILIVKGTDKETFLYDKDGKFLKKVDKQLGMASKPKTKSSSKQKPAVKN
jgi:hypothetical protein